MQRTPTAHILVHSDSEGEIVRAIRLVRRHPHKAAAARGRAPAYLKELFYAANVP